MTDWTEGYVADHAYGNYYFPQLAPGILRLLLQLSGLDLPRRENGEPLRYLELGYGQGLSLNIHAATNPNIEFWGTDFMPEQALNAETLSIMAGLGSHPLNYSFAEFEERAKAGKLPDFDMIVLHGIWSWINDENRHHILEIINTSLRPGGLVYVSYNALPGRAVIWPFYELMTLHAERKGAEKDSLAKTRDAFQFVMNLLEAEAAYFSDNPGLEAFIKDLQDKSSIYLAHEFMNQNWNSFYFFEVAKDMATVDCRFITSINRTDALHIAQPGNTLSFLENAPDPITRQTIQDFNLNQAFRSDIYVKNPQYLATDEYQETLDHILLAMKVPLELIDEMHGNFSGADVTLDKEIYFPILRILEENHYEPKSLAYIKKHPFMAEVDTVQLLFYINILLAGSYISPAQTTVSPEAMSASHRLNRILCELTAQGDVQQFIASPVLGSGIGISGYYQLFLLSCLNGKKRPVEWARDAEAMMRNNKQSLAINTPKGRLTGREAFEYEAENFKKIIMPWLIAMGVIPASPSAQK